MNNKKIRVIIKRKHDLKLLVSVPLLKADFTKVEFAL